MKKVEFVMFSQILSHIIVKMQTVADLEFVQHSLIVGMYNWLNTASRTRMSFNCEVNAAL